MRRVVTLVTMSLAMSFALSTGYAVAQQGNVVADRETYDLLQAGLGFLNQSKYAEADEKFRAVLAKDPNNKWAETNLGVALIRQGKFAEALPVLEKCTQDHPQEAEAYVNLATSYQSLGRIPDSLKCLHTFLKLAPNSPQAPQVRSMIGLLDQEEAMRPQGAAAGSDMGADYLADAKQSGNLMRFAKTRMPLKIYFQPSNAVPGYKPEFDQVVKDSFADWQKNLPNLVSFVYVPTMDQSDISIVWTNDPSKMISSAEGGHAMAIPSPNGIVRSDITLLTSTPNGQPMTPGRVKHTALHEIGHALGIFGHSPKAEDMMYGVIMPTESLSELSSRDKATMFALYNNDDSEIRATDASKMVSQGDLSSPIGRMVKYNQDGAIALKAGNLTLAQEKFEEAMKIDPSNFMLKQNLGAVYVSMAGAAFMKRDPVTAENYCKKAIPLFEQNPDKSNLKLVLTNLQKIYLMSGRPDDAAKVGARLQSLH